MEWMHKLERRKWRAMWMRRKGVERDQGRFRTKEGRKSAISK